jgi:hypothetical protein
MIDFIKIRILNPDIPGIRNINRLEWVQRINERTGEIKEYTAILHGLTFQIIDNKFMNVSGSLHKHWNDINGRGNHNYNDFPFSELMKVVNAFCKSFDLTTDQCIIENFEFGVNISPPIPVTEILHSVINHKGNPFNRKQSQKMNYMECEHRQYYLKFYDKGLQFDQGNILRFEIKTRKMEFVRPSNIQTLSDIINTVNLVQLGTILTGTFNDILFYDNTIPKTGINARERLILTQGQNAMFWSDYKKTNPDNYFKKRNRFKDLVRKYGKQDLQEILFPLIVKKWHELLTINPETLQELTGVLKPDITVIDTSNIGANTVMLVNHEPDPDKVPGEGVEVLNDPDPGTPSRRYCLTCRRDITDQKPKSMFCSAKIVGYSQAHRCRNNDSNPRNRIKSMMEGEKINPPLFDTVPFFIEYREPSREHKQ